MSATTRLAWLVAVVVIVLPIAVSLRRHHALGGDAAESLDELQGLRNVRDSEGGRRLVHVRPFLAMAPHHAQKRAARQGEAATLPLAA